MPRYALFHPDTEILGQVILDFEQAIGSEGFLPILKKHNLTGIEPQMWYPAQRWIDVLNEIVEMPAGMFNLVSIGMRQLELAKMPPEFDSMPLTHILSRMNSAYLMNYRGTDVGGIKVEVISEKHIRLTVKSFEPDDLWYGNIHGMIRRFAPGSHYTVQFDASTPRNAESKERTIFHVRLD